MKVRDLKEIINRLPDDDRLVVQIKTMGGSVGSLPTVDVTGLHVGFDWDKGKTFVATESPVHLAGDAYKAEQKSARDKGEALAFIWMSLTNKSLDDKQKLTAVRSTIRRFGFNVADPAEQP